jgi:serine/threonine-protein kinase
MTASAAIMGSPQYMSPEQIRSSKNVDARADVWALGTILHELVAGGPAYVADTVPGLLAMIVADAPPPLSACRPDTPPELEAIVLRCLEKDRERRFANVAEFARALERFASAETRPIVRRIARVLGDTSSSSQSYRSIAPGLATQHEPVNQTHNTWAHTGRLSEHAPVPFYARPTIQLGAGLGLVGVGLLAAWILFSGGRPTASMPVQTTTTTKSVKAEADGKAAADTAGREPLAPTPTIVRPVREPDPPIRPASNLGTEPEPPPQQLAPPQTEDDDPRAPHNFRDDDTPYPSANAKKKELAAAQKRARPKPPRPQPVESAHDEPPAVSPEAAPKKSNPLDLFDDTR